MRSIILPVCLVCALIVIGLQAPLSNFVRQSSNHRTDEPWSIPPKGSLARDDSITEEELGVEELVGRPSTTYYRCGDMEGVICIGVNSYVVSIGPYEPGKPTSVGVIEGKIRRKIRRGNIFPAARPYASRSFCQRRFFLQAQVTRRGLVPTRGAPGSGRRRTARTRR